MKVEILRLGHRKRRDLRTTTHVGLTGRALGANRMILCGDNDDNVLSSVRKVVNNWGGFFEVVYESDWKGILKSFGGLKIHLTMYGLPLEDVMDDIREKVGQRNLLIVVGAEKVPGEVYQLVDYNVSVTTQPHSEISSLALFLDRFFEGKELGLKFPGGKRKIIPSDRRKHVIISDGNEPAS